jgi:hypothetical protein
MTQASARPVATAAAEVRAGPEVTRALLAGGVVAGPLFVTAVFAQAALRDGFDFKWHPLSLLSLGGAGWIQIANFIVTGALYVGCAVGIRRALRGARGGTWGPRLIGVFGACLIWAGVFPPDPYEGFPPGTPDGPGHMTWHGLLHSVAPPLAFLALSVACLVFARRFGKLREWSWMAGSLAVWLVLASPDLLFGRAWFALALALAAAVGWGWVSLLAARLMAELRGWQPTEGVERT